MRNIFDLLARRSLRTPLKEGELQSKPTTYRPIRSRSGTEFTFYAGEEALFVMRDHVGLSFEEIATLPARVLATCLELGFAHNEPTHFLFEVQEIPREPSWTAVKIMPPIELETGKQATRSIVLFLPTVRQEIEATKNEILVATTLLGLRGETDRREQYIAALPTILKAKYRTLLTHEMVHVFATDEYRELMQILGLDLLELLTDSINLVTFYPDYRRTGNFPKMGVAEGIGYLVNLLRAERPGHIFGPEIVDLAYERAKKIIRECQKKCEEARQTQPAMPGLTRGPALEQIQKASNAEGSAV